MLERFHLSPADILNISFGDIEKTYVDQPKEFVNVKIDYFSAVFKNVTLQEVCEAFSLDVRECYSDWLLAFNKRIVNQFGALYDTFIQFSGLNISFSNYELLRNHYDPENVSELNVSNIVFEKIKVDISGQGLDYLRSLDFDIDHIIRNLIDCDLDYHPTRCDFAFDLVNYCPTFLDEFIKCCEKSDTGTHTIRTGTLKGLKYSIRRGDQKTIYVGSPRAVKLLRVYDKKLQYTLSNQLDKIPYTICGEKPYSWIRIELQTRREMTEKLLYSNTFDRCYKHVFRTIHDTCFPLWRDSYGQLHSFDSLESLTNWERLPSVIQNILIKYNCTDTAIKSTRFVYGSALRAQYEVIATKGIAQHIDDLAEILKQKQISKEFSDGRFISKLENNIIGSKYENIGLQRNDIGAWEIILPDEMTIQNTRYVKEK